MGGAIIGVGGGGGGGGADGGATGTAQEGTTVHPRAAGVGVGRIEGSARRFGDHGRQGQGLVLVARRESEVNREVPA